LNYGTTNSGTQIRSGVTYANLQGTITDSRGNALSNVDVQATTTRLTDNATSDEYGVFTLEVSAGRNENVHFTFNSRGKRWSYDLLIPEGTEGSLYVNFSLNAKGVVTADVE
jgi:hypothetical protein